jgi:hypothetical protein
MQFYSEIKEDTIYTLTLVSALKLSADVIC